MKIGIEAQRIFRKNKHGMDFVVLEYIRALQQIDKVNLYYIFAAPGEDEVLTDSDNFKIIKVGMPLYPLWEQIALPLAVKRVNPDILHCTSNTAPLILKTPLILTIHDVIYLEKRNSTNKSIYQNLGWYYRKFIVPLVAAKAKKILTVSAFEMDRISSALNLSSDKVDFIYNSFSTHFYYREGHYKVTSKYLSDREYLFFLGNTDPKKNTERVLMAYSKFIRKTGLKIPLLIADLDEKYVRDILVKLKISDIFPLLRMPGYIPNSDLPYIYSGATLFLYVSLRESFGIPQLEAMACETPVITSNTSAMPEIAGDAAVYADPFNIDSIESAINEVITNNELQKAMKEKGLNRTKEFSWVKSSEKLLNIYNDIVSND